MQPSRLLASLALGAAALGTALLASGCAHGPQHGRPSAALQHAAPSAGPQDAMHVVPHGATASAPGHGWRYFSNPAARRAVVISPQQDYYYSRGDGLHWVAAQQI